VTLVNIARPLLALLPAFAVLAMPASAAHPWMSEQAMRSAFIGKTLDGHYVSGVTWTETYSENGRLDYREGTRKGLGYWYFRSHVFCTFYDPGYALNGGCWTAIRAGTNCYEFYLAGLREAETGEDASPGPLRSWVARAWRKDAPSTCPDRPSV
jgi:hypothetical protein